MDLNKFTDNAKYIMLALDHRGSFKRIVGDEDKPILIEKKRQLIEILSDQYSAILVDPGIGLAALRLTNPHKPFLLCVEKGGYEEVGGERLTEIEYKIEDLKKMGASGIKLVMQFNPFLESAEKQLVTARQVLTDCRQNELPLFFEIVTYGNNMGKNLVIESVKYFLENDFQPDVFKLEFPGDAKSCGEITDILGKINWILLTLGAGFDQFCQRLEIACKNGCQGFLAGRSVWQDLIGGDLGVEEIKIIKQRFAKIKRIVAKL